MKLKSLHYKFAFLAVFAFSISSSNVDEQLPNDKYNTTAATSILKDIHQLKKPKLQFVGKGVMKLPNK